MFGSNNTMAQPGGQYTWGIDAKGMTYIYDKTAGKMVYYGSQQGGQAKLGALSATGGKTIYEGSQYNPPKAGTTAQVATAPADTNTAPASLTSGTVLGATAPGGSTAAAPKVLDQAQLDSLSSMLGTVDRTRDTSKQKAGIKRDTSKREKEEEMGREKGKYEGKKLSTLQDFAGAKTDTDINTRDTLENLISSLSTMGLGGGRALQRQILDAANRSNRKANATQATNNQGLDSAFNEYKVGNENDVKKIDDQYGYETAEADRTWGQERQNALYKMADVYSAADLTAEREAKMREGNDLNSFISNSAFVNPSYTGEARAMATPEIADYTQDIAQYDTASIGAADGLTPASAGNGAPGNLAMKAIAINDKDLGIKKKTEAELGYGV